RHVAGSAVDDEIRRAQAAAEGVERALVRLVRLLAGDREALVPALRDLAGGEAAEEREDDPRADDVPPAAGDDVCEAGEQTGLLFRGSASNVQTLKLFRNCNKRVTLCAWVCARPRSSRRGSRSQRSPCACSCSAASTM